MSKNPSKKIINITNKEEKNVSYLNYVDQVINRNNEKQVISKVKPSKKG